MSAAGSVVEGLLPAGRLGRLWRYLCYLPDGHDRDQPGGYLLLLLLHGRGAQPEAWFEAGIASWLDAATAAGEVPPLVALAPEGGEGWWVDGPEAYESAAFQDLLPGAEALYAAGGPAAGRVVAGYSMGGYGAVRYALAHPGAFQAAVALSPAIYDSLPPEGSSARNGSFGKPFDASRWRELNYPAALSALSDPGGLRLYLAAGDREFQHEDPSFDMDVQAARLYAAARQRGIDARLRLSPGSHDWAQWAPACREGLRYSLAAETSGEATPR